MIIKQEIIKFRSLLKQIIIIKNYKYMILNTSTKKKIRVILDSSI
jgi:hypothetical protein